MNLNDALLLSAGLIETGETHVDYQHTVELADIYKIFITGKGIERLLSQFVQRESPEMFVQRIILTKSITPAVASSLRKPFNKVARNNRVRKNIELSNPTRLETVNTMQNTFYGNTKAKGKGLDYWLKQKFPRLTFTDPNAWAVVEWNAPASPSEIIQPRPFVVSAAQAVNFLIDNEKTKWLFVKQAITFLKYVAAGNETRTTKNAGFQYTLYDEDYTLVYEQVDKDYLARSGYEYATNEQLVEINKVDYIMRTFEPKIGHVPAVRIGYIPDEVTDDRTFVNPFHEALPFFYKSLKTVSEFDISMSLHAFPQKSQYVYKCQGESLALKCENGRVRSQNNAECTSCKGTGFKIHTTAQDVLLVPMPEEGTENKELWDLSKMIHYATLPIDLLKFQNEYIQQLKGESHEAVFNSQVFVKKTSSTSAGDGGTVNETATANDNQYDAVYDTLEPYTEKLSQVYIEFTTVFAILAGEKPEGINITHVFPANPKLKSAAELIGELAAANASGAPSFMRDALTYELAENVMQGDDLNFLKYQVKDRFFPFSGKGPDEIAQLMSSQYVSVFNKVFYANFDSIFMDIELATPGFYLLKSNQAQTDIVKETVTRYIQEINDAAPTLTINTLRGAIGGATPTSGGNPGDEEEEIDDAPVDTPPAAQA